MFLKVPAGDKNVVEVAETFEPLEVPQNLIYKALEASRGSRQTEGKAPEL
jgi:hypothetical protein